MQWVHILAVDLISNSNFGTYYSVTLIELSSLCESVSSFVKSG